MTDHDAIAQHDAQTHVNAHTALSDDDHGHGEAALGPIDWAAWAYGLLGVAAGALVLIGMWVAIS